MIHGKYHGGTSDLLGKVDTGIQEFTEMGYHVDNMQMTRTDELQMMMSRGSCTSQLHKSIAQKDCAKEDDIMSKNGNDK